MLFRSELLALAKAKPREITYGSAGNGSPTHLGMEIFALDGARMVHVPYKGAAPALVDLLGGHVQVMMTTLAFVRPHAERGRLRALGVSTAKRSGAMPDVPAIAETVPGYEVLNWWGVLAPAGTPAAIVAKMHGALAALLRDSEVKDVLAREGMDAVGSTPAQFAAYIGAEIARDRKSTRLNSSHVSESRMPSSA